MQKSGAVFFFGGAGDPRNEKGAILGRVQTAPTAEAYAVAALLTMNQSQVTVATENKGGWRQLHGLKVGRKVKHMHQAT